VTDARQRRPGLQFRLSYVCNKQRSEMTTIIGAWRPASTCPEPVLHRSVGRRTPSTRRQILDRIPFNCRTNTPIFRRFSARG